MLRVMDDRFELACAALDRDLEALALVELSGPQAVQTPSLVRAVLLAFNVDSVRLRGREIDLDADLDVRAVDEDEPALAVTLCGVAVARAVLVDVREWDYEPAIACRGPREEIYQRGRLLQRRAWRDAVCDTTVARVSDLALTETRRRLGDLLNSDPSPRR